MFSIVKDIPKPDDLPGKRAGANIYPFGDMEVGDSFVVPYGEMKTGETSERFRARIYQSAREYARRHKTEDSRLEFTAAVMKKDDDSENKKYVEGDVVVWRDK